MEGHKVYLQLYCGFTDNTNTQVILIAHTERGLQWDICKDKDRDMHNKCVYICHKTQTTSRAESATFLSPSRTSTLIEKWPSTYSKKSTNRVDITPVAPSSEKAPSTAYRWRYRSVLEWGSMDDSFIQKIIKFIPLIFE